MVSRAKLHGIPLDEDCKRAEVLRMIAQGVSRRTAYRRLAQTTEQQKQQDESAFDYEANTPKGEWI